MCKELFVEYVHFTPLPDSRHHVHGWTLQLTRLVKLSIPAKQDHVYKVMLYCIALTSISHLILLLSLDLLRLVKNECLNSCKETLIIWTILLPKAGSFNVKRRDLTRTSLNVSWNFF